MLLFVTSNHVSIICANIYSAPSERTNTASMNKLIRAVVLCSAWLGWLAYSVYRDYDIFRTCVELDVYMMPFGVMVYTTMIALVVTHAFELKVARVRDALADMWIYYQTHLVIIVGGFLVWVLVFPVGTFWYMIKFSADCRHRTSTWHLICYWLFAGNAACLWLGAILLVTYAAIIQLRAQNMIAAWRYLTGCTSRRRKQLNEYFKRNIGTEDALRLFLTEFRQTKLALAAGGWFSRRHGVGPFSDTAIEFGLYYRSWSVPSLEEDPVVYEFLRVRGCIVCDEGNWHSLYQSTGTRVTIPRCGHIAHDFCMKRMLRAESQCIRCFTDFDPVDNLRETSRRHSVVTMQNLEELAKSADASNFTPEHRKAMQKQG